ncbi:MAG TPA: phosphotransferase [Rhizomicrobium sp.]|nr:phosphotransferase [Rhizomicrobium sp.]
MELTSFIPPAHRFDAAALDAYLKSNIRGFAGLDSVQKFSGGASNPTFLLTEKGSGRRFVLRKKPPGQLLSSAHQVDREFRIMKALEPMGIPVPHMQVLCEDSEVIGTPFYVMDFVEGRIFRDARLPGLSPRERAAVYDELNATLAKLHSVDIEKAGLSDFGRAGNYFERQIGRWTKQYRGAQTQNIPEMENLIGYLPQHIPEDNSVSIAHGDYRPENTMFHPTEPRLIAVLDWELCTIGHPLADLAYNCLLYTSKSESWGTLQGVDFRTSGIPSEDDYVAAYCKRTGREKIENWNYYLAFSLFRLASISQGVYKRALDGNASSDRPAINGTPELAAQAWSFVAP